MEYGTVKRSLILQDLDELMNWNCMSRTHEAQWSVDATNGQFKKSIACQQPDSTSVLKTSIRQISCGKFNFKYQQIAVVGVT